MSAPSETTPSSSASSASYSYHPGNATTINKNVKAADAQRRYRSRQVKLLEITTARAESAERNLSIVQEELAAIHAKLDEILVVLGSQKKGESFTSE